MYNLKNLFNFRKMFEISTNSIGEVRGLKHRVCDIQSTRRVFLRAVRPAGIPLRNGP